MRLSTTAIEFSEIKEDLVNIQVMLVCPYDFLKLRMWISSVRWGLVFANV